jgi:hypothetical protein
LIELSVEEVKGWIGSCCLLGKEKGVLVVDRRRKKEKKEKKEQIERRGRRVDS